MTNMATEPAVCRACGKTLSRRNNLRIHYRSKHPELARLPMAELVAENATPKPPARRGRPPGKALMPVAPPPEPPPLGADDVDDVVLAVLGQAAPSGMIPVAHLAAVFAWREATAAFLREISR